MTTVHNGKKRADEEEWEREEHTCQHNSVASPTAIHHT